MSEFDFSEFLQGDKTTPFASVRLHLKDSPSLVNIVAYAPISTEEGVLSVLGAFLDDYEAKDGNPTIVCMVWAPGQWLYFEGERWKEE